MPTYLYEPFDLALPAKFLTTQSVGNILATRHDNFRATQFVLGDVHVHNRSGSTVSVAIGGRIPTDLWELGQWDQSDYASGEPYTDDTTDAQDAGTGDVDLDTVGTNNDGILIASDIPFNCLSVIVSQASANGTAWDLQYSKATEGTGFSNNYATLSNAFVAPDFSSTGEQLVLFNVPNDWVQVTSTTAVADRHGDGVPQKYVLLIRATTAPDTTQGQASLVMLGRMYFPTAGILDGDIVNFLQHMGEFQVAPQCDALAVAISTANTGSRATGKFRLKG